VRLFLIVPMLAKELPADARAAADAVRPLHATRCGPGWRSSASTSRWTSTACGQLLQYLQGNYEDALRLLVSSLKVGGSFAFTLLATRC
jgi:hypothetical protein